MKREGERGMGKEKGVKREKEKKKRIRTASPLFTKPRCFTACE